MQSQTDVGIIYCKYILRGYCFYAIHSRTIFFNFSLFGAAIFKIYEVKSVTFFRGRLCFKGDRVSRKYGTSFPCNEKNQKQNILKPDIDPKN